MFKSPFSPLDFLQASILNYLKTQKSQSIQTKYQDTMQFTNKKKSRYQRQAESDNIKFSLLNKKNQIETKQSIEDKMVNTLINS